MHISQTPKYNPYNKPNPFKLPTYHRHSSSSTNISYLDASFPKHIDYWKFSSSNHKSSSYLPKSKRQLDSSYQRPVINPFTKKDNLFSEGASLSNQSREYDKKNIHYLNKKREGEGMSNPFLRKNLVIYQNTSLEESNTQYSYNKYLANEFTPVSQTPNYFLSAKSNYQSSRPSESRQQKQSDVDSINYSLMLNLFDRKSSYLDYKNKSQLKRGISKQSPRQDINRVIVHEQQYPRQIKVKGSKYFRQEVYQRG